MSDSPRGPAPGDQPPDDAPTPGAPAPGAPGWDALARLLAGEPRTAAAASTDASADATARAWLAAHPAESARLRTADVLAAAALTRVDDVDDAAAAPVDVEAALARVKRRLAAPAESPAPAAAPRAVPPSVAAPAAPRPAAPIPLRRARPAWATRTRWLTTAGVLASAAVLTVFVTRRSTPAAEPFRYATVTGQRTTVRLPDGTRVTLGPSSTVASVRAYNQGERTVTLEGDAYFEVVHDDARPFVVYAGPAVVRDLGTAFVVRAGGGNRTLVAVTEGSVQLAPTDPAQPPARAPRPPRQAPTDTVNTVLLRAGDRGAVDRPATAPAAPAYQARRLAPARATSPADDLAWTTGRLVFRDAALPEVADALRRWYGLTLRVTDPALAGRTLTASFQGEPPAEVLRVVTLALGARYDRRGDTVFVRVAAP